MFKKVAIVLVLVAALVISVACGGPAAIGADVRNGLDMIPASCTMGMYVDFEALRADPNLGPIYDKMEAEEFASGELSNLGISLSQISYVAAGDSDAGVMGGNFNFGDVRTALGDLEFEEDAYSGVEIWYGYYGIYGYAAAALIGDKIVWGEMSDVQAYVNVLTDPIVLSFYDNTDAKAIVDKLSGGNTLVVMVMVDSYEFGYGVDGMGMSFNKVGGNNVSYSMVMKCVDSQTALAQTGGQTSADFTAEGITFHLRVSGQYITMTATMPIDLMMEFMEY